MQKTEGALFMTSYHRLFAPAETAAAETYFAGGNSPSGYKPLPGGIFRETDFEKLYILKGGPGTGKSTLIAEVGQRAAAGGARVVFYACGSDSGSFDGIVIEHGEHRIGVLDGTPPHAQEPLYPGVLGEYVNLGAFWDSGKLESRRREALSLAAEKAAFFADGWRMLGAADLIDRTLEETCRGAVREDKMEAAVSRLLAGFRPHGGSENFLLVHGVTMRGAVSLPTLAKTTKRSIAVLEEGDTSRFYLAALRRAAVRLGFRTEAALSPLRHDLILGVRLPDADVSFAVTDERTENGQAVNMERFPTPAIWRGTRQERRRLTKRREELFRAAEDSFRAAGKVHFELEELYGGCMDFDGMREMRAELAESVSERLFR